MKLAGFADAPMIDKIDIEITPEILKLIAEIDEFKGGWEALKHLSPERLNALKKVATIESVGSSTRIEGAKLSDTEVEQLLSGVDRTSFASRDEEEVVGYAEAMDLVFESWREINLTENHIKQLHGVLLKHSSKDVRHRGEYKKHPNHVEAFDENGESLGVIFETTSPFDTPREMMGLVSLIREEQSKGQLHPLIIIAVFVVCFLAVHPFQDGNGRLSRILATLMLLREGYDYVLYSSLEHVIEENKDKFYLSLRQTQKTLGAERQNWLPWLIFFLQALKAQKDRLMKKAKTEKILLQNLPELSVKILSLVKERGRITISEIEVLTSAPKGTIKDRLRDLVKNKMLIRHGKARSTWYTLP